MSEPVYFATAAELRRWFKRHAARADELIVGFHKVGSGVPSITWPESVDEALCVGWIDGVRHRIDEARYRIRFTPRKAGSHWSAVNIRRVDDLVAAGRMTPAGLAVFARRTEARSRQAAYEQAEPPELTAEDLAVLRADPAAWAYYQTLPRAYRTKVHWWVVRAKQAATRERRLAALVAACAAQRRL